MRMSTIIMVVLIANSPAIGFLTYLIMNMK